MENTIEYKNFTGTVEYSEHDGVYFGSVTGVQALISYEGQTKEDLLKDFHEAIDDYLELTNM